MIYYLEEMRRLLSALSKGDRRKWSHSRVYNAISRIHQEHPATRLDDEALNRLLNNLRAGAALNDSIELLDGDRPRRAKKTIGPQKRDTIGWRAGAFLRDEGRLAGVVLVPLCEAVWLKFAARHKYDAKPARAIVTAAWHAIRGFIQEGTK